MGHGRHIKVIGVRSPGALRSVDGGARFLTDLVDALGMRCLGQPHICEVDEQIEQLGVEPFEGEGGVTGTCVLSAAPTLPATP